MSNCVHAHACYGVIMYCEDAGALAGLGSDAEEVEEALSTTYEELALRLRRKYNAGDDAGFFYTGDEEVHYDNSGTPEDTWIIGYGVMQFPDVEVPEEFKKTAKWHLWVEVNL